MTISKSTNRAFFSGSNNVETVEHSKTVWCIHCARVK